MLVTPHKKGNKLRREAAEASKDKFRRETDEEGRRVVQGRREGRGADSLPAKFSGSPRRGTAPPAKLSNLHT
jgi:hypothetical protein